MYTSDYILDETITTVLVRGNRQQSIMAGKALLTSQLIQLVYVAPEYLMRTWELYQKYKDKKFSFTDVSCFAIMENFKIHKAFSFDHEFVQAGIELVGCEGVAE